MLTRNVSQKRKASPHRQLRGVLTVAILTAIGFGAGVGDTLYVGRRILPIRSGKFAFDKVLGTARQRDTIKVTAVEGKYLKVLYAPKDQPPVEGYVMEAALTVAPPEVATTQLATDHDTLVAVAAGKGVVDSKAFASAKGLSPAGLETMEAESQHVMNDSDAAFVEFMKAGKIGLFKPQPTSNP